MSDDPKYNWVYRQLVQGPDDVRGALAYVLYKKEKIAYIEQFAVEEKRQPSDDDMKEFHRMTQLPDRLALYRDQADTLLEEFLNEMLADRVLSAQEDFRTSHLSQLIRDSELDIETRIQSAESVLKAEISKVDVQLSAKKGVVGWVRDLGTNFLVNVLTIVLVGLAAVGLGVLDSLSARLKNGISAPVQAPQSPPAVQGAQGKQ